LVYRCPEICLQYSLSTVVKLRHDFTYSNCLGHMDSIDPETTDSRASAPSSRRRWDGTMSNPMVQSTNFGFLAGHDVQVVRLGALAERYFGDGPNTAPSNSGSSATCWRSSRPRKSDCSPARMNRNPFCSGGSNSARVARRGSRLLSPGADRRKPGDA
jgi:hypothetical protein